MGLVVLAPTCQSGITQRGTYPIEIFSEMHYSQAYKNQEPPRLSPAVNSQAYKTPDDRTSSPNMALNMKEEYVYDPIIGAEIYRVNCSFCHGLKGMGDGTVAAHISSEDSFFATTPTEEVLGSGSGPYKAVPQLHNIMERYDGGRDSAVNRLNQMLSQESGSVQLGPMPSFLWVFTKDQRKQVIDFIVDENQGLASGSY